MIVGMRGGRWGDGEMGRWGEKIYRLGYDMITPNAQEDYLTN
ncbi:MAG: hypothetical protein AAF915_12150 [Cyanobacteria bacterium P01_D01_bin.50]